MDDFNTLSNRLLTRCSNIGAALAQQLINDNWHTLQAKREWSWRRRYNTFAPPNLYQAGQATTNVAAGQPTLITGTGTVWTPQMVGRQIRIGGLLYPYYTIVQWLSATAILIDQPWAGEDVTLQPYQILQIYYPVPADFGYFEYLVSVKDAYRLWTTVTAADLAMMDPQRTNTGQTYATAFHDYSPNYGGIIGPVIGVTNPAHPAPISTTSTGYSYVANATYIIQVVGGGVTGTATFQWMRAGQTAFTGPVVTAATAQNLMDGVQIYWPPAQNYVSGDIFVINAQSMVTSGVPRYELWPGPTFNGYLYPYSYVAKESDLTPAQPQLPNMIAARGEVILEMALAGCARYPGADIEHPNPYFNLSLALQHETRVANMMVDLERNDEEIGVSLIDYQNFPLYPAPWSDGHWQATHAPFLR